MDLISRVVEFWQLSVVKIFVSAGLLIGGYILYRVVRHTIRGRVQKQHLRKQDGLLLRKLSKWLIVLGIVVGILLLWGGNVEDVWVGLTTVLGIIAIGFFAVWSILSNIVSGMVILLTRSFRMGDRIEIVGDGVRGAIENITLFHVVITEEPEGHTVMIPNNVFIQKTVRIFA